MTAAGIRVVGLRKAYGDRLVLDRVSLEIAPGEIVALLGPSGIGKTTLFRCLTRLLMPEAGEMWVAGHPMHRLERWQLARARHDIGHVFQAFNLVRRLSALDNAVAGRLASAPLWRVMVRRFPAADRAAAVTALERVGLSAHVGQRADRLSGGQQQRVAITRALVQGSRVLLADEPVASLDPDTAKSVLGLLREISREQGITVLCSLHQPDLVAGFADRVIAFKDLAPFDPQTSSSVDQEDQVARAVRAPPMARS
ncbi:MAG TPA: ATP-binding cassette domain-containing protein [Beijerinckiaceae bacterium]|nr:ATP-binding cassette domain-containing protein [Beijerinckiaceae bacterium]